VSFCTSARTLPQRFRLILTSFLQHPGLPFAEALPEARIQAAFEEEGATFAKEEGEFYTPALTLWAFLSQVLHAKELRSCRAAVARVVVLMTLAGRPPSDNTGAYCRARAKLSETVLRRLTLEVASGCEQRVERAWLWRGRHVKLVDGTTVSMPDTRANQAAYPQPHSQQKGLGFPIARLVVLLSLATGMVSGLEAGPYAGKETGETALLRALLDQLDSGEVLLADRYYCSYFLLALLQERGVDFVTRLHQMRKADFRRGQRLGHGDHLVEWTRPAKPKWMDEATYQRMPEKMTVRETHVQVEEPGFRTESFVVVTSLTQAWKYSQDDVAQLYRQRWLAELDIRAIKITLGMDVLRCKSPEMVRRELWTCVLAYNLLRQALLQAAQQAGHSPRSLSLTAALQKVAANWLAILVVDRQERELLIDVTLQHLAGQRVGDRPNRVEPRAIKRRPKPHKLLRMPRAEAKAALLSGHAA